MKKIHAKMALMATMLSASVIATSALAADGTVTFVGKVQAAACAITAGDENQTVNMGVVSTSAFRSAGDVAAPTAFNIRLENCPASVATSGTVSIRFDGTTDPSPISDGKLLKNDAASPAGNVAIGIWNANAAPNLANVLGRGVNSTPVAIDYTVPTAGTAKLPFVSRYVATSAAVSAGDVHAVSDFTVIYN